MLHRLLVLTSAFLLHFATTATGEWTVTVDVQGVIDDAQPDFGNNLPPELDVGERYRFRLVYLPDQTSSTILDPGRFTAVMDQNSLSAVVTAGARSWTIEKPGADYLVFHTLGGGAIPRDGYSSRVGASGIVPDPTNFPNGLQANSSIRLNVGAPSSDPTSLWVDRTAVATGHIPSPAVIDLSGAETLFEIRSENALPGDEWYARDLEPSVTITVEFGPVDTDADSWSAVKALYDRP